MGTVELTKKTVNLSKGEKVDLTKYSDGLKSITVGLGWDPVGKNDDEPNGGGLLKKLFGKPRTDAVTFHNIDCDAWAVVRGKNNIGYDTGLVYYGNLKYTSKGKLVIKHNGDNLTGEGDGDDEQIEIYLENVPDDCSSILIGVTIYLARERNQSFDMLKNNFIRVVDNSNGHEICRFEHNDMSDSNMARTFIAGKLLRDGNRWTFEAIGKLTNDSMKDVLHKNY